MVTDPIQHDRPKGDRRRRRCRQRVVRGASYSKYDTRSVTWGSNPERHGVGRGDGRAFDFPRGNVGHGGFRLSLTLPCTSTGSVVQ